MTEQLEKQIRAVCTVLDYLDDAIAVLRESQLTVESLEEVRDQFCDRLSSLTDREED